MHNTQCDEIIESDSGLESILQISRELKSSLKKQTIEPKVIKQLKSKNTWMKYMYFYINFKTQENTFFS